MKKKLFSLLIFLTISAVSSSYAQTIPAPSRTVFKCEIEGKVVYSDSPCIGAKRVDIQPSRGLNKTTGSERVGADIRREHHNEQMAEALRPILGENAEQRSQRHHRAGLKPEIRTRCAQSGQEISAAEKAEIKSTKENLSSVQSNLYQLRKEYRDLRC